MLEELRAEVLRPRELDWIDEDESQVWARQGSLFIRPHGLCFLASAPEFDPSTLLII